MHKALIDTILEDEVMLRKQYKLQCMMYMFDETFNQMHVNDAQKRRKMIDVLSSQPHSLVLSTQPAS